MNPRYPTGALLVLASLSVLSNPAPADTVNSAGHSGNAEGENVRLRLDACRQIAEVALRLDCYDRLAGDPKARDPVADHTIVGDPTAHDATTDVPTPATLAVAPAALLTADTAPAADTALLNRSSMTERFELDDASHRGLLRIRTYYPIYVLPANWTDRRNEQPSSPTRQSEQFELDSVEAKFQLSLKTKLYDNLIGDNGDLWAGYTQVSHWQAYNGDSAPFRETNYMPELFMAWRTGLDLGPLRWQMVNLGLIHQSNGRGRDLSRSWNRFYAMFGFEAGDTEIYLRPWIRVMKESDDDNPDIEDYLGYGDLRLLHRWGGHDFTFIGRYNPSEGNGAVELGWHWPLMGDLKGHARIFSGYGDSLIDYNHNQTTVGIGVSLVQW